MLAFASPKLSSTTYFSEGHIERCSGSFIASYGHAMTLYTSSWLSSQRLVGVTAFNLNRSLRKFMMSPKRTCRVDSHVRVNLQEAHRFDHIRETVTSLLDGTISWLVIVIVKQPVTVQDLRPHAFLVYTLPLYVAKPRRRKKPHFNRQKRDMCPRNIQYSLHHESSAEAHKLRNKPEIGSSTQAHALLYLGIRLGERKERYRKRPQTSLRSI